MQIAVLNSNTRQPITTIEVNPFDAAVQTLEWLLNSVKTSLSTCGNAKHLIQEVRVGDMKVKLSPTYGDVQKQISGYEMMAQRTEEDESSGGWVVLASPYHPTLGFQVFVRMNSGPMFVIQCEKTDSVAVLVAKACDKCKMNANLSSFVVYFQGRVLKPEMSMEISEILPESCVELRSRLCGGSAAFFEFVDVESESGPTHIKFGPGPEWRCVVAGLNIHGYCMNESCSVNGDQVITNQGYGLFDLPFDAHKARCPVCQSLVKSEECGFYNCEYRFAGYKPDFSTGTQKLFQSEWKRAKKEDQYWLFEETQCGMADWSRLVVETKPTIG
ncbi:hypothetical protein BC830DRAFT_490640 [Chytriomyces sp. MP71]|nr:hypothetical protein BC830DRAFT_490640 [Chytriomyces sp. MP71]